MLLSLTKYNVLLVWPHKIQLAHKSWLAKAAFDIKKTYLVDEKADAKQTLAVVKEIIVRLEKWRPVTVVLFGNKVRYRLLKHHSQLSPSEFLTLTEYQFKQILGTKAFEWQYFSQAVRPDRKNLTTALHSHWLDRIQSLLIESHIKLFIIQPAASWLFNHFRKRFDKDEWIVLRADAELFIFKLDEHDLDHFKKVTLKSSLAIESVIRREILAVGDTPENTYYKVYDLNDIAKSRQLNTQVAVSDNLLIRQNPSS